MAQPLDLNHEEYFAPILESITNMFPIRGTKRDLLVSRVYLTDQKDDQDLEGQKKAVMRGQTWGPKLMADVRVVDKDGKTVAEKRGHFLGRIPQMTPRFSFDVGGTPYKVAYQTRLKSGAYPRVRSNGELETQFNLVKGENFRLEIDPKSGRATMTFLRDRAKVPVVPILRALGIPDQKIRSVLGGRIMKASDAPSEKALARFHTSAFGKAPAAGTPLALRVREFFDGTEIRPDTTEYVYGKPFERVDGDLVTRALGRMLGIYKGTAEPVNRDSEVFKEILPPGELVADRIQRSYRSRTRRIQNQLDLTRGGDANETVGRVLPSDTFDLPIRSFFTSTASSGLAAQLNPINMITGAMSVSPMGEGGISNPDMIMDELKRIDASRTGIHDPIQTPEGGRTGVTTFLARGARIRGRQAKTQVWDVKAKQFVEKTPMELSQSVVAFADQYSSNMQPNGDKISAFGSVGEEAKVKPSDVDYVMPTPDAHFSWATNMIPFLPNNQGNRSNMVYRHFEQTIGLKNREAPLVQVRFENTPRSYEDVVGGKFSSSAPTDGTVTQVSPDKITIKGKDGKRHDVSLYNNFPLGDNKAFISSTPVVEKGQEVKAGDLLADSNFTKGGTLAIGANFRTAVIPYRGWNFEDGYVISESAAQRMTSEHMHSKDVELKGEGYNRDLSAFKQFVPTPKEQLEKLDDDGVVKIGQSVEKGDVLVAGLKKREWEGEMVDLGKLRGAFKRGLDWRDASMRWDSNFKGVVVDKVTKGGKTTVYVRTDEPAQVGDKITNRHAAKGVIVRILPDSEMPRTADGRPAEILLNPTTVGGRINSSQINELVLGRVAEKTGETYTVKNFDQDESYIEVKAHTQVYHTSEGPKVIQKKSYKRKYPERIMEEMQKAGVEDREEMIDPETGKPLGRIMVGPLYFMKLMHQAEKKAAARGLGPSYDISGIPRSGGKHGAQAIGELGIYAMLAHGNVAMLRGAQTYKGDATQQDFFTALQQDEPLPPVQVPNAFKRFEAFLKASGINIERDGDRLYLLPAKDEEVLARSNGEVDPTKVVKTHTNTPEKGGIFDEKLTGGKNGKYWTHFPLNREMINPVYEGAVKSILGLTDKEYQAMTGVAKRGGKADLPTLGVDKDGNIVPAAQAKKVGQDAIIDLLRRVNVAAEWEKAKDELADARESQLNKVYKRFRALDALKEHNNTPEAFIMKNVAVAPPIFRPITKMASGAVTFDDMNQLYRDIGLINNQFDELPKEFGQEGKLAIEANLYDALGALSGLGGESVYSQIANSPRGNLKRIAGDRPKEGFFQKQLIKRRNDMTMRATIIPDTTLSMDQVGIPEKQAYQLYKPLVVRDLVRHGFTPLEAEKHIKDTSDLARNALDRAAEENPILLKRDPVLHKFGILGFEAKIVPGESIRLHPLVTTGFNADFDGDEQINSVVVHVTDEIFNKGADFLPNSEYTDTANFWRVREMPPRIGEKVGCTDARGHFCIVNLEDFPHLPQKVTKGHIDYHPVPEGVRVVAAGPEGPVLAEVAGWSHHRKREIEIVTLGSGRQIVTDDDERAVFGVDASSLEWCRRRPSESQSQFVPVLSSLPELEKLGEGQHLPEDASGRLKAHAEYTYGFGYFLGAMVSNGWSDSVNINYATSDVSMSELWKASLLSIFDQMPQVSSFEGKLPESKGCPIYTVSCQAAARAVESWIGSGAENKHLPPFFMTAGRGFQIGLLSGLMDTDGSSSWSNVKEKPQFIEKYASRSLRLVQEIQHLFRAHGVSSAITATRTPQPNGFWVLTPSSVDLYNSGILKDLALTSRKQEAVDKFLEGPPLGEPMAYSRYRLVPLPSALAKELRQIIKSSADHSVHITLSKAIERQYVSKEIALRVLSLLEGLEKVCHHPLLSKWKELVRMEGIHFERVVKVDKTKKREDGYDLTVPGYETFMSVDGVILSNTMSAYVAVTPDEISEARRIFPSHVLFSPVTGDPAFVPTLETQIGLYLYSLWGKDSKKTFANESDVLTQLGEEKIAPTDVISLNGKKTTAGRVALNRLLDISEKDMSDPAFALNTKQTRAYLTHIGKSKPAEYGNRVDKLKNIGNEHVYRSGWTYSLKDFMGSPLRDKIVAKYQAKIDLIPKRLNEEKRQERIAAINADLEKELKEKLLPEYLRAGNTPAIMLAAGTKPGWAQLKQLNMTPGALPAKGKYGDIPKNSYGEGVSLGDYYRAAHSARQGVIDKVFGVRGPGYLSKQLANTVVDLVVHEDDCGTKKSQALAVDNPELPGRYLAKPLTIKGDVVSAGAMVTPELQAAAKSAGLKSLDVRSPLGHIGNGMCKKCYGHYPDGTSPDIGDNIGIVASQAFGERSAQLKMRTFHTGGIGSSELAQGFDRVQQLFLMPKDLPGKAALSPSRGVVSKIRQDRDTGARYVTIDEVSQEGKPIGNAKEVFIPPKRNLRVNVGAAVLPGSALSDGPKDPRELLKITGDMDQVRGYLTEELYNQFKGHGITRLQSEVVVKGLTDLGVVESAGEHSGYVRGDKVSLSEVEKWNSGKPVASRVKVRPVLVGAGTLPLEKTRDFLARMNYQRIMPTIVTAANQGWYSDLHGFNPIPGLAYGAEFGLGEGGRY